jgi:hypothetical protein
MGIFYGVNNQDTSITNLGGIVTDSLRLYLDAGKAGSYPKTGGTWSDLSGNGTNVTLYKEGGTTYTSFASGPPTHTTNALGEFTFDGTNDWGKFPQFSSTTAFSVSAWVNFTATGDMGLVSHCNGGPVGESFGVNAGKMQYWYYNASWQTATGTSNVNTGTWKNIVFAKNGTSMLMYINGSLDATLTLTGNVTSALACICSKWGPCYSDSYGAGTDSYGSVFNGTLATLMIHTKQLSAAEVTQNYNSLKRRFGL